MDLQKNSNFIFLFGVLLTALFYGLFLLSDGFKTMVPLIERQVLYLTSLLILSSIIYLLSIYFKPTGGVKLKILVFIFLVGLILRLLMVVSTPMLEDDHNRYLWDGAVTANNVNPYKYSPNEVKAPEFENIKLKELSDESGHIFRRINHSHLKTVYPPVAQLVFSLSYKISSWNIKVFKLMLLLFDLVTFVLLFKTLKELEVNTLNILIYWWNPLLVKEIFNSGHFEVIAFPFVLGALFLVLRKKYFVSVFNLALGVGVKLWPLVIVPLIIKPLAKTPMRFVNVALFFAVSLIFIFSPIYEAGFDSSSGYLAYGKSWENNSLFFKLVLYSFQNLFNSIDMHPGHAQRYARLFIVVLISFWVLYQTFFKDSHGRNLYKRVLFIVAALFLLSPTQFPWYYTWILPFLVIVPRWSLLVLTMMLPLYYTRFYLEPRGELEIFKTTVVWIEFVPVWVLIFLEWKKGWFKVC